jgi:hypothetical protein
MERFRSRKESFDSVSVDSVDIRTNVPLPERLRVFLRTGEEESKKS